ncbi:threonyl-tRNA synthetase [Veillonella parvula DSM 2008]|mgnify:FL=1|uniref:threonine--tRNA ligase n=1 Tax=Veillonella parvula TaxID=29466 RepID=UPI00019C0C13|nr:threonine--tRNA ligase [Veillonella parvula]ACZ24852.1 threonyl-tRNA synthetase [Veillonella parvula DSM 2008]MDU3205300.1 threonine--tRNA ligase [Veillonella parvula]QQB17678.1 threonine--tRNA ligase [Veillonella parvula]SNU98881.1 Threonine--tRNA ligase [Veillonella parvula]
MADVKIILPDGSAKEYAAGTTLGEAVKQLSNSLAKKVLAANVNGELTDLREELVDGSEVAFLTFEDEGGKHTLRHTASHILAQAVKRLWPEAKLAIGPAIDKGFYYDIDMEHILTPEDLGKIEKEMSRIVKENLPITKSVMPRQEAIEFFKAKNEDYKVELIQDLPEDAVISCYSQGDFIDLCAGPHVASTGKVKAFKLQSIAGAYWRGDEKNKMLQRIYGTAFEKKEELDAYLHMLEEAAKRDHRKLGKELGLFVIKEEGPGFPFFLPKGMALRNELENFWREVHHEFEYEEIRTPIILNKQLWETSGHWFHYRENMYTTIIDEEEYAIKPMNCPGGILVYQNEMHSYRDFPLRYAELGLVHRHELSGALHGLFRVRAFTQDDAHVFMLPSQMQSELMKVIELFDRIYSQFGLKYHVELSTKPDNAMGDDAIWEAATEALRNAIEAKGIPYVINPGDGAFYGPKLDYHIEDSLGRTWQCGTIQLDMNLPERFQIEYVGEDGQKHRPIMIHRACFGSMERFIGILTEHYAGAFPTWMAPVQVKILPISEKHVEYAKDLAKQMHRDYVRVEVDDRSEKIGYKIRQAQMAKVPYMLVVGDKEVEEGTVNVRKHGGDELGSVPFEEFFNSIKTEIKERN